MISVAVVYPVPDAGVALFLGGNPKIRARQVSSNPSEAHAERRVVAQRTVHLNRCVMRASDAFRERGPSQVRKFVSGALSAR